MALPDKRPTSPVLDASEVKVDPKASLILHQAPNVSNLVLQKVPLQKRPQTADAAMSSQHHLRRWSDIEKITSEKAEMLEAFKAHSEKAHHVLLGPTKAERTLGATKEEIEFFKDKPKAIRTLGSFSEGPRPVRLRATVDIPSPLFPTHRKSTSAAAALPFLHERKASVAKNNNASNAAGPAINTDKKT